MVRGTNDKKKPKFKRCVLSQNYYTPKKRVTLIQKTTIRKKKKLRIGLFNKLRYT